MPNATVIIGTVCGVPPRIPRYKQIVDALRQRIRDGDYGPGSALPQEQVLREEFGVSLNTIRQAIAILRGEGLVYTEHGRATFVRPNVPVRRVSIARYRADLDQARTAGAEQATSFTRDHRIGWDDYRLDVDLAEVPADDQLAALFTLPVGTPLLRRRLVFYSKGHPQQMSYSYFEAALIAGTPVADPEREPWPGGSIAQLYSLGVEVTTVEESVRARMPTVDEAAILRMSPGQPVLTITRRMLAGERPVEAAVDIVMPSDRVVLDYRIDL